MPSEDWRSEENSSEEDWLSEENSSKEDWLSEEDGSEEDGSGRASELADENRLNRWRC